MGYTFTFGDIQKICRALNMQPKGNGRYWTVIGPDGVVRWTKIDSHGPGGVLATGTASRIAHQLGFSTPREMYLFLKHL